MAKSGATASAEKVNTGLEAKKARRLEQSKRDLILCGGKTSRKTRALTTAEHRCQICSRPSARVRSKIGDICTRCSRKKKGPSESA